MIPVLAHAVGQVVDGDHDGMPAGSSHAGTGSTGTTDPIYPVVTERLRDPTVRAYAELLAAARRLTRQAGDVHAQANELRRTITPKANP